MDTLNPNIRRLAPWLALAGLAVLGWGLYATPVLEVLPIDRARESLTLAMLGTLLATGTMIVLRCRLAHALALVALVAHVAWVGPVPLMGALLLAGAAIGLGSAWARGVRGGPALALIIGLALIAAVVGWLLPFKLHRDWLYASVLLAVIVVWRRAVVVEVFALWRGWQRAVSAAPWMAAFAMIALGLAATPTWLPTMQFDDLAYHLGLPAQLQSLGYYRLDPASQVWALAPWGGDVIQAIVQVTVGAEARGSVNLLWLAAAAWLLFALARSAGLSAAMAWLGITLMASLPMTAMLMGGMQTEGPGTACVLALALLVQRAWRGDRAACLRVAAVLAGFLLALKASFAVPLVVLGAWLLWQWRGRLPWAVLPQACALGLLVGGSSYVYAWMLAGNPVLPLFNSVFGSPFYPASNFFDPRYTGQFALDLPWRLVFETGRTMEGWSGSAGFQLIGLAGCGLLALAPRRTRPLALVAWVMLLALLLMAQYLRYAHPAMVLLLVPMLAGLALLRSRHVALAAGLAIATLNLAFQTNINWMLRFGAVDMLLNADGDRAAPLAAFTPERLLVRDLHRHARVLLVGRPYHAELAGRGFVLDWYDTELNQVHAEVIAGRRDLGPFLFEYGFTHVLVGGAARIPDLHGRLRDLGADPLHTVGDATLWRLPDVDREERRDLMRERNLATQLRRAWR